MLGRPLMAKVIYVSVGLQLALLLLLLQPGTINTYKFLGVLHFGAKSHFIVGSALMKGLARQGHEVTVISTFPQTKPLKNYYDIPIPKALHVVETHTKALLKTTEHNMLGKIISYHQMGLEVTEAVLEEPAVQALMASNETFDAVICEVFLSEALFGLSEHFKAPLIGFGTFGAIAWNTDMVGSPSPPSYVPHVMMSFTDHMSLAQRLANLAMLTFERTFMEFFYLPQQEKLYRKHFPQLEKSLYEIRRQTALVLLNTHVSLSYPRPYMPNQIEIGGLHINRQRNPLPLEIEQFINSSKHGVVYFSMGSAIKSKRIPLAKRQEILKAFRQLKQRVLWKFEESHLPGKPDNVFISSWFPQDDILAHPQVKVFVTHGGLLSTTESIYHGKPVVGLPIFGDQFLNMAKAVSNGYGIMLDYKNLSAQVLKGAIENVLLNDTYTKMVRIISQRYRDQPMDPLTRAIYWIEHVVRHKGAKYMHCAGLDLNFLQYHNLDAIFILYGGIGITLLLVLKMIQSLLKWCFRRPLNKKSNRKKMKNK